MSVPTFKVIVIGDEGTGKTSIIYQYIKKTFPKAHFATPLPVEQSKNVNNKCNLNIWDTAGSKDWQSMNESVYHGSNAVIYLSSFNNQESLSNLKDIWFPKVNRYLETDIPSFLVVNKDDLEDNEKTIETNEIEQMKNEINACELLLVSAKENKNVDELFELVANKLTEKPQLPEKSVDINDKNSKNSENSGGCGC